MFTKYLYKSSKCILKNSKYTFSSQDLTMPIIQLDKYINKSQGWEQECKLASECLHDTGILVIKDSVKINLN
jgi:hypothetical protein